MEANVDIAHIDDRARKLSKCLESSQYCPQIIHKGDINDTYIGTNFSGEAQSICPEHNTGEEEKVEENITDVFNRIYVKNMIKTCVDKLGTEYERGSCRKVASVGAIMDDERVKDTKIGDDKERKDSNEVHLDITMSMAKHFRC